MLLWLSWQSTSLVMRRSPVQIWVAAPFNLCKIGEKDITCGYGPQVMGSNPISCANKSAGLAQLGEHLPYKQRVGGSSPSLRTRRRHYTG